MMVSVKHTPSPDDEYGEPLSLAEAIYVWAVVAAFVIAQAAGFVLICMWLAS